jgi:hypothetical protein
MNTETAHRLAAVAFAVVMTAVVAFISAYAYGVSWREVAGASALGAPVFVFMFAAAVGWPSYFCARLALARWTGVPYRPMKREG